MNALLKRLVSEAVTPIEEMSARFFKIAALFFVTISCLLISAAFFAIAFFTYIQTLAGTAIAALATGSLFLGAAGIFYFLASRQSSGHAAAAAGSSETAGTAGTAPPRPPYARNIDEAVAPILSALRDAGFERERIALAAGTELAKQLHPFSLVATALVAGFILGRVMKPRTKPG
jgi:hypothetical protein